MIPIYKNEAGADVARIQPSGGLTRGQMQTAQLATMAAQVVGDVVVGLIQNKTQKDFNKGKLEQLKEDSRLNQLTTEQRLAFDKRVANAVNDIAKLRIYQEELGDLGVASIQSTASIYAAKLQGDAQLEKSKTIGTVVLASLAALLIGGTIYVVKKN